MKRLLLCGILFFVGFAGTPQQPPQFDMNIEPIKLADNLYVLQGAGGNVVVFVWESGALLIDDKLAPVGPELRRAVAAITPQRIRFVINTHWHRDHSGGNEALATEGAVIVAHENVRKRMSVEGFIEVFGRKIPPSPPKALPIVTFTRDVTLHLGGEEISVVHVAPAHTDGDSFIRLRNANVIHLGDCYLNGSFPVIDHSNGGTYTGLIAAADTALGMLDGQTRIIPGHGPEASQKELREWRTMLMTIYERVRNAVESGMSLEEIKKRGPTSDWDARFPKSFVTSDHVVEEAYRDATSRREPIVALPGVAPQHSGAN